MKRLANVLTHALGKWSVPIFASTVVLGLAMCCPTARAQTQSGLSTIQGTVTDSTGAVIRNAAIHVVDKATGAASNTKSNGVGFYQAPGLLAGAYTLTVTAPGMKTYVYAVEILATQTAVVNPVMTAGAVTQQITVSAN
ncbi:MAG: carboxypeptidase-like regulatory domain-containing protein, partial [Terriglobia bacterium]